MFKIEVAYATSQRQSIAELCIYKPTTVAEAIQQSGILEHFPEIDLEKNKVGIFSKPVKLSTWVKAGDRIEIYRSLVIDPKQARLLRSRKKPKL